IAVFATTTTTELFFRQAVGRVVRWTPGLHGQGSRTQPAWFFLPDDPRLRRYSAELSESRRHSLSRRRDREELDPDRPDEIDAHDLGDDEQMSLFSVIGAVAIDGDDADGRGGAAGSGPGGLGVFGDDRDDPGDRHAPEGVELVLLPPPLPGGGHVVVPADGGSGAGGSGPSAGPMASMTRRERKARLRDQNADVAAELVRSTGWGYVQVQAELNR